MNPAPPIADPFEYVGFWRRLAVVLLDALISLPLWPAQYWAIERSLSLRIPWPAMAVSVVWVLIATACVVRLGGTPGKLILGIRIVESGGRFLSVPTALRRGIFDWGYVLLYWLSVFHAIAVLPPSQSPINAWHASELHAQFGGIWNFLQEYYSLVSLADVLVVATNRRKRALHDFLAGSFVITRRSYDALRDAPSHDATVEP